VVGVACGSHTLIPQPRDLPQLASTPENPKESPNPGYHHRISRRSPKIFLKNPGFSSKIFMIVIFIYHMIFPDFRIGFNPKEVIAWPTLR
jgi:hypothetical protein